MTEPPRRAGQALVVRRAAALVLDSVVAGVLGGIVGGGVGVTVPPDFGLGSGSAVTVAVYIVYFVALEAVWGETPGKSIAGLEVVHLDGTPIDLRAAVVRNVLRIVDWLPAFYLLGVLLLYVTDDAQRLGDLAAATVVRRKAQ